MKVIYSFEYIFLLLESLPAEEMEREKKTVRSEVEETETETKTEREKKNGKKRRK